MKHVDSLGRCWTIYAVENEILARLKRAQSQDEEIAPTKEVLKVKQYDDNIIKNELSCGTIQPRH